MIIIVEGIDRVGKTTLCNKLSEELGMPILKDFVYDEKNFNKQVITEKIFTVINCLKAIDVDMIIDRFHISEIVYGFCDREYLNDEMFEFDEILAKLDTRLIMVQPCDIERSSREHGKNLKLHEKMFNIVFEYSEIKEKYTCDYNSMDRVVAEIKRR